MKRFYKKCIVHPIQAFFAYIIYSVLFFVPLPLCSSFGGFLGRKIGPLFAAHKIAKRNLDMTLKDKSEEEKAQILDDMWDNIGRTFLEYPKLRTLTRKWQRYVVFADGGNLEKINREIPHPYIYIAGHFANWELSNVIAQIFGRTIHCIYQRPDNTLMEPLFNFGRKHLYGELIPKGVAGFKIAVEKLRKKESIAFLIDQKLTEGVEVPFFGIPAKTSSAPVKLAAKYGYPMVPCFLKRNGRSHTFSLYSWPAVYLKKEDGSGDAEKEAVTRLNEIYEEHILNNPGQWFWVHRRFDKKLYL